MGKGIVLSSFPSISFKTLTKPRFTNSPPFTPTVGQAILGKRKRLAQYFNMGKASKEIKEMLELPEAEPLKLLEGPKELPQKDMPSKASEDAEFKKAATAYIESPKPVSDDSYEPPKETLPVMEKNSATLATGIATVSSSKKNPLPAGSKMKIKLPPKITKAKKNGRKSAKKPSPFRVVSSRKKK